MNEMKVPRGLGWFSIGLGLTEIIAGRQLGRALGMEDKGRRFRVFGVREAATGIAILSMENPRAGVWAREPLLEKIRSGEIDPTFVITHKIPLMDAPAASETFRDGKDGCIKVVLKP